MAAQTSTTRPEGGNAKATTSFVDKLYSIVEHGDETIVGWSSDGSSFIIKDTDKFCKTALAPNFKSSLFSSFVRQLHFCKSPEP